MLHVGICDDEKQQLDQTAALLDLYFQQHPGLNGRTETFISGDALIARAEEIGGFDLYVLDILMPNLNGIETSRRLRALGDGGEIVYLTSSNDFAADSYDVRAFFYLLKPMQKDKLFEVLDGVVDKLKQRRSKAVVVNTSKGPRRILMERIRYAERVGRCVRYNCTDGTLDSLTIRVPFKEMVAPLLTDRRFFLCGASFVLNFQHVMGVNGQTVILDNGKTLNLPRTAAPDFKKAWGNYWLEEYKI